MIGGDSTDVSLHNLGALDLRFGPTKMLPCAWGQFQDRDCWGELRDGMMWHVGFIMAREIGCWNKRRREPRHNETMTWHYWRKDPLGTVVALRKQWNSPLSPANLCQLTFNRFRLAEVVNELVNQICSFDLSSPSSSSSNIIKEKEGCGNLGIKTHKCQMNTNEHVQLASRRNEVKK